MSDSGDGGSRLDEEIRHSLEELDDLRRRRWLLDLETKVAEAKTTLREAEERLGEALQGVGLDASGSASCQPPVTSKFSVSVRNTLIESVADSRNNNTTPINSDTFKSDTFKSDQVSTNHITPLSCQKSGIHEGVPSAADLPAAHQLYIPAPNAESCCSDQSLEIDIEGALLDLVNETISRPGPSECSPNGWTYRQEEEKKQHFDANSHKPDNTADANFSQPQRITQPALPWVSNQHTPAHQILATPPNPAGIKIRSYRGMRWSECVHYINTLEAHFVRYPKYYTEALAVELGAKYISPALEPTWRDHQTKTGGISWLSFCIFLAQRLSHRSNDRRARDEIANASQKPAQPVTHFALWLIQWAPVAPKISSKTFMETLQKGVLPVIRDRAHEPYEQFSDYMKYAMYLQEVENTIPSRKEQIANRQKSIFSNGRLGIIDESGHEPRCTLPSGLPTQPARRFDRLPPRGPRGVSARSKPYHLPRYATPQGCSSHLLGFGKDPALQQTARCRRGRYPR